MAAPAEVAANTVTWPKELIFELVGYRPRTPEVADFHASTARTRIVSAPARTSKSYSAAYEGIGQVAPDYVKRKGNLVPVESKLFWLVGPTFSTNKEFDYFYRELVERPALRETLGYTVERRANSPQQGNMLIVLNWGRGISGEPVRTIIEGKSATTPETLQGEEVHLWISSEAADQDEKIWARYGSTRAKLAIFPTTPKLRADWLLRLIEAGPDAGVDAFTFTPHANPTYDWDRFWEEHAKAESRAHGRILTDKQDHDCFDPGAECPASKDSAFAQQFLGHWTHESERVLPFRRDSRYGMSNVIDELPAWFPFGSRFVSMDYGFQDASCAVWFCIGADGTTVAYREIYEKRIDARELVRRIFRTTDEAEEKIEYFVADPQKPEVEKFLRELGLPVYARDRGAMRDRKSGYMRLISKLSVDPAVGHPGLLIASEKCGEGFGCPNAIREMENLRRKPGLGSDEWSTGAIKGDDHAVDCMRYFLASRPSGPDGELWDVNDEVDLHIRRTRRVRQMQNGIGPLTGSSPRRLSPLGIHV